MYRYQILMLSDDKTDLPLVVTFKKLKKNIQF